MWATRKCLKLTLVATSVKTCVRRRTGISASTPALSECAACGERRGDRGVVNIATRATNTLVARCESDVVDGDETCIRGGAWERRATAAGSDTQEPMTVFATDSVESADGTTIGFRRTGSGRPLVLVHGGMLASQHFVALAGELAADFEVVVPDRHGRGMSGPYGEGGTRVVDREACDIRAVIAAVGAHDLFGLSTGALVSLGTALDTTSVTRLALYEPPLSVDSSVARLSRLV
jgi:hypothetical protein